MLVENEYRVIGPPGCGKTTYLADQVQKRVAKWCEDTGNHSMQCNDVLLASLTRTAAAEIRSRGLAIPAEQVGTLHAHALRALGKPKLCVSPKAIADWNKESPMEFWRSEGASAMAEEGISLGKYNGDALFSEYTTNRCRLTPREQWRGPVLEFAKAYESWKYRNNYLDYDDLIIRAYEDDTDPPGNPSTILGDEQQDSSAAEFRLMRHWAAKVNKLILVGDADQCQPAGTMITTTGGEKVDIADLKEGLHELASYSTSSSAIVCRQRKGRKFRKTSRYYSGPMYTVSSLGRSTRATSNHKWLVKEKRDKNTWVVYMMNLGDRYRIGWCRMFSNKHLSNHFNIRCRCEGADYGWILGVFNDKVKASSYEKVVSIKYGLPLVCFRENAEIMKGMIDEVFRALDSDEQHKRACKCLVDHHRDISVPYYSKRNGNGNTRRKITVESPNLIPEFMQIPVPTEGRNFKWSDFSVESSPFEGEVYSLDVEIDNNYIADGIVTHNCIFQFRGGDPGGMFASEVPADHEKVLEQSYRVPRAVHAEAMRVIERVSHRKPVIYYPRDEEGEVERTCWSMRTAPYEAVEQIERLLDEPDERPGTPKAMCIFSCAYQANALMAALRSAGIPYWNPYARERGNFNPLHPAKGVSTLDRILDYLRSSEACHGDAASVWTWEQFQNWTEMCSSDGWLRHGAKAEVKRRASATPSAQMKVDEIQALISHEDVLDDLAECSLEWLGQRIAETKKGVYSYVMDIAKKRGWGEVKAPPRVVVGTCHSIKGAESENVFVCPDLSVSGWETYGDRDGRDSIFRLYYVALTRARRRLILTAPSCPQAIDL